MTFSTPTRGTSRARIGIIGVVVTALVVITALQMDKLPFLSTGSVYTAYFSDAGGLRPGDVVVVSGVQVGTVNGIALAHTDDGSARGRTAAKVSFTMADGTIVGTDSQASIKTETVLGRRNLTVEPHGSGRLRPGQEIPFRNTLSPYSLTDALDDTTSTLEQTDTGTLNRALNTLSDTFSDTPPQVRGAVDGVARLSKSIADRDDALRSLLGRAKSVTDVVAQRGKQINTLLVDANSLLGELQARRMALGQLIVGVKDVAAQVSGFIADNNAQLNPVLTNLNKALTVFEDNRANLNATLDRLGPYANVVGEAVSSGPYFSSYVGIPTFGDYTNTFLLLLRQKYPEAYKAFTYSGNPLFLSNFFPRLDQESDPDRSVPVPDTPRDRGQR
ncbi:MCE family protein [Williamsia deligens]|uniref:MCE family protein n=1 Tax=Williamsia deligens TaxID=321325 RepID=A0ABW3G3T2_9NOCA|nr:MCE family protein [Williamsia deligens]MCP2194377.1 phospholipid/cholesterol/gamma-HCH transport system substrate-binding protein [Williamsia deligens]